ncbi:MAG: hypothetical protein K0S80_5311, partial [Neobacillus sp.]|nr:hypothetical protein [Neobacillus sp.]
HSFTKGASIMMLQALGLYTLFVALITVAWRGYEVKKYGKTQTDTFHPFIVIILSLSMTVNVLFIILLKG